MNLNLLKLKLKFITNFKPKLCSNIIKFKKINKNKIYCKNFFFLLLLLKFFKKKNFFNFFSIYINKKKKKSITLLRAPYRYKLARHQIVLVRYKIFLNYNHKFKYHKFNINLIKNLNIFFCFFNWIETNIIYQHKFLILFFYFDSYFYKI